MATPISASEVEDPTYDKIVELINEEITCQYKFGQYVRINVRWISEQCQNVCTDTVIKVLEQYESFGWNVQQYYDDKYDLKKERL